MIPNENEFGVISLGDGVWVGICLIIVLVLFVLKLTVFDRVYKGKVRRIEIIKKRVTHHNDRIFLSFHHNNGFLEYTNLTVDYRYEGRKFTHTKYVSEELYKSLKTGRVYTVRIKGSEILRIIPEEKRR